MLNSKFLKNSIPPQNHIVQIAQGQTSNYYRLAHEFDLYKAIMSFPNGSSVGPDKKSSQNFKNLVSKSKSSAGFNYLKLLTKLVNFIVEMQNT